MSENPNTLIIFQKRATLPSVRHWNGSKLCGKTNRSDFALRGKFSTLSCHANEASECFLKLSVLYIIISKVCFEIVPSAKNAQALGYDINRQPSRGSQPSMSKMYFEVQCWPKKSYLRNIIIVPGATAYSAFALHILAILDKSRTRS